MARIASQPTNGGERTCMYIQISEQVSSRSTVANRAVHSPTKRMGFIPRVTLWLIG
jgi:hypothetical protein